MQILNHVHKHRHVYSGYTTLICMRLILVNCPTAKPVLQTLQYCFYLRPSFVLTT